ncbi:SpoIIE family protein phosphatase [Streptomyces sp. DW26H14]|uniref:SpoIIE family protein phosphatase n=1 Tax=Streptomyces sp. DW26H14 TaxID=3435395 RepID=UPI00403DBEDF
MVKTGRGARDRRGGRGRRGVGIARDWVSRREGEPVRGEETPNPRPSRFRFWLPIGVIFVGVVFDSVTPTRFTASPFFAAAPMVAAPFFTFAGTAVVALVSIATEVLLRLQDGTIGRVQAVGDLITVVTVSALALGINRIVRRSGERLASARIIAEAAQRAVLPQPSERIGGLHIAARYEAAQEDAFIGGDLFAVQDTPHGVRLIVGDVRGKGMEAVETVAVLVGAFREAAEQERTLEGVAHRLDRALMREGTRRSERDAAESFTTAVLAEIPRGEGIVRLVNRGHPEPMLLESGGVVKTLEPGQFALPLGMTELGVWPDRADTAPYPEGATLLFYTDGLSEARDSDGVFYDPAQRLNGRIFPGPEELLDAVVGDVRVHTGGGTTDDMALLAVSSPGVREPKRRRIMNVVPPR